MANLRIIERIPYYEGMYYGELKDKNPHGWGILTYLNEVTYVGKWERGQEHGTGKLTHTDGTSYIAMFVHGRQVALYDDPDGCLRDLLLSMENLIHSLQEDLEIQQEDTMNVQRCLSNWQDRFDRVATLALNRGVDAAVLHSIRNAALPRNTNRMHEVDDGGKKERFLTFDYMEPNDRVGLEFIPDYHRSYDPLQYPLLFPDGQDGWHPDLDHTLRRKNWISTSHW